MSARATLRASVGLARDRIRQAPRHAALTWLLQAVVLLIVGRLLPGVFRRRDATDAR